MKYEKIVTISFILGLFTMLLGSLFQLNFLLIISLISLTIMYLAILTDIITY